MRWGFIIGMARGNESWGRFAQAFKNKFPNSTQEFYEYRGNGDSTHLLSPLCLDDYVEEIRKLARSRSTDKINLISISMGSMVAARWAELYPNEIDRLVLMNMSSRDHSPFYHRLRFFDLASVYRMYKSGLKSDNEKAGPPPVTKFKNVFRQAYAASKYKIPERCPIKKTLLLASDNDHFVSNKCSKQISRVWNVPLVIVPNAGHVVTADNPEFVLNEIDKFIKR